MSVGRAFRESLRDFYFNSWRLAPANLLWGVVLIAGVFAGPLTLIGFVLLVSLALPTAGIYRMAALVARGEPAAFSDFIGGIRAVGAQALGVTVCVAVVALVLTTNILLGVGADNVPGWFITAMAMWGLVGLALFLVAFWPILLDPEREAVPLRRKLALAGFAVLGRPVRMIGLTIGLTVVLAASTVLFAALVLVSVAYVALVASRVVLPLVDEVEARLPEVRRAP